jgi:hypothetical protein
VKAGDIGFAHSNGFFGRCIRWGERIRWGESPSHWNHVFIVDRVEGDKVFVIQAEPRGVTNDKTIDTVGEYQLVSVDNIANADDVLTFARKEVGSRYGWLSIVSIAIDIVTPNWFPAFRRPYTYVCSALGAEALRAGGWIHRWADVYTVTPAQLKEALSVE